MKTSRKRIMELFKREGHVYTDFEKYILTWAIDEVEKKTGEVKLKEVIEKLNEIIEQEIPSNLYAKKEQERFLAYYHDDIFKRLDESGYLDNPKSISVIKAYIFGETWAIYRFLEEAFRATINDFILTYSFYNKESQDVEN